VKPHAWSQAAGRRSHVTWFYAVATRAPMARRACEPSLGQASILSLDRQCAAAWVSAKVSCRAKTQRKKPSRIQTVRRTVPIAQVWCT
jgi:hypothetical protein